MKKLISALFAFALLGGLAQAEPVKAAPKVGGVVIVVPPPPPPSTMSKDCGSGGC